MTGANDAQHSLNMQLRMRYIPNKTTAEVGEEAGNFVFISSENRALYACFDRNDKRVRTQNEVI